MTRVETELQGLSLGGSRKSAAHRQALKRVKRWTRVRFSLAEDETILVSEIACALPGCAPLETIVAFWTKDEKRHHFKIFKPVEEALEDDLPPSWMKNALVFEPGAGCDCC
ncbi:MAG TPA: hypothetical protein VMU56_04000 [Beijerinckiaceae bacterium]|nr:hypothetical protein [Beijerinckiaceae bacterium]